MISIGSIFLACKSTCQWRRQHKDERGCNFARPICETNLPI